MTRADPDRGQGTRPLLWAGVYCPALPLAAAWSMGADAVPHAVHDAGHPGHPLLQVDDRARQRGARPGQSLTQALAIVPDLLSRPRDATLERRTLERMALRAYGHSHQVVLAPPDSLLLEVAGSRRLRGGLKPLFTQLRADFEDLGLVVHLGSAPTPAAARILARHGRHALDHRALAACLRPLPAAVLSLDEQTLAALAGCGLKSVGDLLELPAASRARRFGPALNRELERITGAAPTPLTPWQPPVMFDQCLELPVATTRSDALQFILRRGLADLGRWLEIRDHALTRLHVSLLREDRGGPPRFSAGLARPGRDMARLLEVIMLKLDTLRLPAAISACRLRAETTDAHRPPQADLFSGSNRGDAWPALLDRLSARLGEERVKGIAPRADHRPEKSWVRVPPGTRVETSDPRPRPTWLLPEALPCDAGNLQLEEGPERIESGWWDGEDCRRDYYVARDARGRRLWVFREFKPRRGWFVHGLFG